jgi:IS4 transposase
LKAGEYGDWAVQTAPDAEADLAPLRGRVVAFPKTEEATQKAIRLATKASRKKGHQILPQTLVACGYLFVFTTLLACQAGAELILALYRFRWQVEMAFKLLKSQLHLDHVRAHDAHLVRTYLLCKLLGALLLEDLSRCWVSFSP